MEHFIIANANSVDEIMSYRFKFYILDSVKWLLAWLTDYFKKTCCNVMFNGRKVGEFSFSFKLSCKKRF